VRSSIAFEPFMNNAAYDLEPQPVTDSKGVPKLTNYMEWLCLPSRFTISRIIAKYTDASLLHGSIS
jgi:hypothetical protein